MNSLQQVEQSSRLLTSHPIYPTPGKSDYLPLYEERAAKGKTPDATSQLDFPFETSRTC